MKVKRIMLIVLVLLAVLTIGAASAADDVASDDLAVEDIDEVSVDTSQDDLAEDSGDVLASSEEETVGNGEGYNITFHEGSYDQYDYEDDTHMVEIQAPEEAEFNVVANVGDIGIFNYSSDEDLDFDDDAGIYYLIPYDFSDLDAGTYEITVSCFVGDNKVASQTGTLIFIGTEDDDDDEINVNIWDVDDERGILYLDTDDGDIVSIDVPPESEGTIFVIVNGEKRGEWVIAYDDTDWTSCQWNLQDLRINETGNYTIEVKYNEETISEGNITVEEWEEDSYRAEYIENEAAFVIYYVPGSNGTVFVKIENDDDGETVYDKSFNFTSDDENLKLYVAEFDIESDESYHIVITVSEDPDFIYSRGFYKEGDDDDDGNEFEAKLYDDEPMLFYWDSVLEVYCPDESTGTVTVTVKDEYGEIIYTSNKDVDDADEEGKLYWTLAELNITSVGKYTLEVSNDGEEIDYLEMEAFAPIWIEDNTFINSTDKGLLVSVFLPISIENATIIVSIEDKSFSFSLNDFVYVEDDNDGSKPIWFNPGFGPEPDMNQKSYRISNGNLEFDFEEKTYEVYVKLMIEGMDEIIDSNDVEFISRNVIGNDNVTIEIFNGEYAFDFGDDVVKIAKEDDCRGYILITVADNAWNKTIDLSEIFGAVYLCVDDFADLGKGEFEITVAYYDENDEMVFNVTGTVLFYYSDDDADDGVVIHVLTGDEKEFDLNNQDDLDYPFAYVSVRNDIDGRIVIIIWDEEGDEQELCSFDLDDITNTNTEDYLEGFTVYMIALNDLENYNDLIDSGRFKLAFIDYDDEIDSRTYNIEVDEDNDNIICFWEDEGDDVDEEIHGEGEEIKAEFTSANILDNGVVVTIPVENVPQDVDNEFTVVILQEDDEPNEITFKLDEILEGDNYIIRVNDLQLPEFRENYDLFMFLQFYSGGEKAYYAEYWDDEFGIHIYESPCIFDETSLLNDDDVITIQEIPDGVDEFTVTISKEGSEDIVKTFKFSDMDIDEEEVWVALKLTDLGITEEGDYEITVKYSDDLIYTGNLNVNKNVDIRGPYEDDEGNPIAFTSIDQRVVNFRISGSVTGYVKIYVDGTQVGGDIDLDDLRLGGVPPHDGRQVILNDLNITESGDYTVKVELYSDADELLGEAEYDIIVEVGESSVEIKEGSYPYGTEANDEIIEYTIGSPLAEGQYFNIYFNGIKAGEITVNGIEFNDEFTVPMFNVLLFKPGSYEVNVTFVDGESETELTTGSFSINELILTSDKEVYVYDGGAVIISFNADSLDDDDILRAYYVYYWGPVGRDDNMIFPGPYGGREMKEDGMYNDGIVSFDVAHFVAEPDNDNYRLDVGDNLIYAVYRHGDEAFGGFIVVTVIENEDYEQCIFMTTDNVNPHFEVNTEENVTGNVIVKCGENIIKEINLEEIAEYDDNDERWHHDFTVDWNDLDEGDHTVTITYEDEDGNVIDSRDFDIVIEKWVELPRIFIMWSNYPDGDKVEYSLDSTDMVHIYPKEDNSDLANIRIIVKIGDETYLNATLAELNLEAKINNFDETYYTVGPVHFTKEITPGHYDNVIAYYDSDNYHVTSADGDMPDYANLFGNSSVTFSNDIEYTHGDSGTTTMTLIGATVSEGDISVDGCPEAQIALEGDVITVSGLDVGNYTLKVVTTPVNEYYRSVEAYANIKVKAVIPVDPKLSIASVGDVEEGSDVVISISALANFTGSVKVSVGGVEVGTADVSAGSGTFTIAAGNFTVGANTVKVVCDASENFTADEANVTFNVTKKVVPPAPVSPELSIAPVDDVEQGTDVVISITALGNFTGSVKVSVGDVEVGSADVSAGSGTFTIAAGNFTVGANTVKVVCDASENFTADEANVTFNVTKKVVPPAPEPVDPNLTISIDDIRNGTDAVIIITTNQTFSGNVTVQIARDNYDVSVVNGIGSYTVSGLAVGNYTAVATFKATEAFNASTKNATFKVNKEVVPDAETAISTDSADASAKNPVFSIKLPSDAKGTLSVKIGDNVYTKELENGEATIEVTNLTAGTYEAVVSYSGDAKYAPISKTVNSTVKVATTIKAAAVTTTYGTSKNIVITLTDANGKVLANKKVTVVLNGAKKELTTNDKGQVSYAIGTKLAVKKYDATFTFDGDANYVKSTGTAKVTVNKAKPKLTAKKKTFKAKKKSKKYTVTLKTNKGKAMKKAKVTLTGKFKGKKIKITKKTNKKGKVTFNLKKLNKKGKFKATIKFAGNKYYKAVSKKVKITVK